MVDALGIAEFVTTLVTRLASGEVAEFDTQLPHWFGPAGDQPVEILTC